MALGYEGLALLNVMGRADFALCTGTSFPRTRNRLDSSSGYGGKISSPLGEMGIGYPRSHDHETYDGSIDLELHEDFFVYQIKPWLFDRQRGATLRISSRDGNNQIFDTNAFWNSISISAAESSAVEASIGFVAIDRNLYNIGGGYTSNVIGAGLLCPTGVTGLDDSELGSMTYCPTGPSGPSGATGATGATVVVPLSPTGGIMAKPLNPGSTQRNPIPFWNTKVIIEGTEVEFISWTVNFNQDVVKFYACEADGSGSVTGPLCPKYVAVGPMTAEFQGEYFFVDDSNFSIPSGISDLSIKLASESLSLQDLELETSNDDIPGLDSVTSIPVNYSIYGITGSTGLGGL